MQVKLTYAQAQAHIIEVARQLADGGDVVVTLPDSDELRERLADLSHEIWSSWMRWQFDCGRVMAVMVGDKEIETWVMPPTSYARWRRQMQTPYSWLSEQEKESDREQAYKILAVLNSLPEPTPPTDDDDDHIPGAVPSVAGAGLMDDDND